MALPDDPDNLHARIHELRGEHRDLDTAIEHLSLSPPPDELMLRRLKKRRLQLRDRIITLERMLAPDEPA
ncbi:MAG: YdcH family protein [Proteobacteria bacterium]|nr:YdcH family protein [Pseudomonadota bacterium]HQR04628.1 YdcH family protein [Rhodocyclaceae bacterium]